MREELMKIEQILLNNGWTPSNAPSEEDPDTQDFVKSYDGMVVGLEVALEPYSLCCYGRYGVCSIEIVKTGIKGPLLRDDLRFMWNKISDIEQELLKQDVPFRPTYGFGKHLEHSLGRNVELRETYHLDAYEKED